MNREGHEDASFFIGTEVEYTPTYGKKTLFIVGVQDPKQIITAAEALKVEAIYFGANHSFNVEINDAEQWTRWESMISQCLEAGYWCTLDMDSSQAEGVLESPMVGDNKFIPMIAVKLPYIEQYGYNACLKIDDKDFQATNPGVWTHRLHDLMSESTFTHWSKYVDDKTL